MRILLVPGGGNSGPEHWHTHWETSDSRTQRVVQADWSAGTRDEWVAALDRDIRSSEPPVFLAAHSLGCIAVVHWAESHVTKIAGALLVAPADVGAEWATEGSLYRAFRPFPMKTLPFRSTLVASTNDPYLSLARAEKMAVTWGSRLEVVGPLGHIGSDSKLAFWEDGRRLLDHLIKDYEGTEV